MSVKLRDPLSECEREAIDLLRKNKVVNAQIIRRDTSAILFVQEHEAWTAWVNKDFSAILRLDRGFIANFE